MKKQLLLSLITLFVFGTVSAQVYYISTIAGNDTVGFTGDGGQATAADLDNPIHTTVDKFGNLYIADNMNQRVRKVNINGIISTIAGNGTKGYTGDGGQATAAELNTPNALAFDDSGNLYICTLLSCVVRKVDTKGIITTIAGTGSPGFTGDGGPATNAKLGEPRGVALDDSGNIFIADDANSCVRKVEKKTGIITTIAGQGYNPGYSGDGGPATAAQLNFASQLAIDDSGNIFIDDLNNNVIRKVNTKGIISTFAGNGTPGFSGDGGLATNAQLDNPFGVTVDKSGNVFITDASSQRVRRVNKGDTISTIAGTGVAGHTGDGGPALLAEMNGSIGINSDTLGNLYVSEYNLGNDDIRKLAPCNSSFAINPTSPVTICNGQSIVLSVPGGSASYQWSPSAGLNTTTGDSVIATPTTSTTYTVTSKLSGCNNSTDTIIININPAPNKPTITVSVTGDSLISSASSYNQWYFDNQQISDSTRPVLIIKGHQRGWYYVTVTNPANGCSTTSDSTTSINQLSAILNQLSIYPNPFNSAISVLINSSVTNVQDWSLQLTDVLGRTVFNKSSLNYNIVIGLSYLPAGVYFITISNKTERATLPVIKDNQ